MKTITHPLIKGNDHQFHPIPEKMINFIDHLRLNKYALGPAEAELALAVIALPIVDKSLARTRLKSLLTGCLEEWRNFDDLFEAFWFQLGKERPAWQTTSPAPSTTRQSVPKAWDRHLSEVQSEGDKGYQIETTGEELGSLEASGRLIATTKTSMAKVDLRQFIDPTEIQQAEALAFRIAKAMRYRLSRRYRISKSGQKLDLRRTIRSSLSSGGEPLNLKRKARPDRSTRLVIFLDVSGSMKHYSRFFLQFVKGLVCQWMEADAYLFHTRLIRITDVIRDKDSMKAMTRLSLMAGGFGGGTKLGESLANFNKTYAKRSLNSRSIVLILSDGYDTGPVENFVSEMKQLKKRAPKLIWLNPLLGWKNYEPVTQAMSAARPFIDYFAAANTLESLAAIEPELSRI